MSEQTNDLQNAESYLKEFVYSNINMRSLLDFYNNEYYDEGILNMYMRVLDVYNEFLHVQKQRANPNANIKKVKVFDTISVRKIIQDRQEGGLDEDIDNELEDFYENDVFILPIFKEEQNRC